jgi:hypothetical protein
MIELHDRRGPSNPTTGDTQRYAGAGRHAGYLDGKMGPFAGRPGRASAPTVTAALASAQVRLDWQPVGAEVALYETWRLKAPYFAPGDTGAERPETVTPGGLLSWAGGGNPEANYTYRVRSLNALSQKWGSHRQWQNSTSRSIVELTVREARMC